MDAHESSLTYRQRRTLGGDRDGRGSKTTFNHDGLLLDIACWLDACDQDAYSHYMRILWELMKEMQESSRPQDRV